ncbi:MAG: crosslink repair DNA glycosylase YcaQ family protein [Propionibacteriaceae bacterium]|nr:crosslink repair DNA glycosylase YcaQ family protein [Propionibacteriaceae bacterium]
MTTQLSAAEARRVALAAQGFAGRRSGRSPSRASIERTVRGLGLLQLDSVNVFERSHYLPVFSRLGPYDKTRLDALTAVEPVMTECWAHEAALVPVDDWPLFEFRRVRFRARYGTTGVYRDHPELRAWLLRELRDRGPLRASDIDHDLNRRTGPWWGLSTIKRLLELMFLFGEVATVGRLGFERRYALHEQALPTHVLNATVAEDEAKRQLVRRAAMALGVGTADDLADYYRLPLPETRAAIEDLAASGELIAVQVAGWERGGRPLPAWLHRDAVVPGRLARDSLLTPFDPIVWHRPRAERLHQFHYRIEIYTPAAKRRFGYYSLPVLLGNQLAARVDLKNDRKAGVLRIQSVWSERHTPRDAAPRIAGLLQSAAAWQGLTQFLVQDWGDLAAALAAELRVPLTPRI